MAGCEHTEIKLSDLSIAELYDRQESLKACAGRTKELRASLAEELFRRFGAGALARLAAHGKESGTTSEALPGGYGIRLEVKKEVKWDSAALLQVSAKMAWDQVVSLFKIEMSVPERVYNGLSANPELKQEIDRARTVTHKPQPMVLNKEHA